MVEPSPDGNIALAIQNHSLLPVHLEGNHCLGSIEEAVILSVNEEVDEEGSASVTTQIKAIKQNGGRRIQEIKEALGIKNLQLVQEDEDQLLEIVEDYSDIFALDQSELGHTEIVTHTIDTGDHPPVHQPARRIPFALRAKVEEMVDDMIEQGVVQPSTSPWASPIVLVAKKDGTTRFCVDYRRLNSVTKKDVYPLPRIDDTLDSLARQQYFTTLDLASGYWQVGMDGQSQEKTAFITHSGLYEFRVMPFGLCNAPATFQRLMEVVLQGLVRKSCLVYLDDILVIGRTFSEHLSNLVKVFSRLRQAGLRLKPSKCCLARTEVEYLGHVVSQGGVAADPKKVEAVQAYPVPTNLKGLRSFLGLASYYRRFIPNFSSVARPLHILTRKNVQFDWTADCQTAFDTLKKLMTQAPLLAYPDFTEPFMLETDASVEGLGAVLAQKKPDQSVHPIAYASRTLLPHERNYGISELEGLGVVWAVKTFRHYLYGHKCHVYTDHEALKALIHTPHPSGKLARWGLALQELDLQIHYQPGKQNANADTLSRTPIQSSPERPYGIIAMLTTDGPQEKDGEESLASQQLADPTLRPMIKYLSNQELPEDEKEARELMLAHSRYSLLDGVLYYSDKKDNLLIVPPTASRRHLFEEAHNGIFGGHLRDGKIYGQLARHYWWPKMRSDIVTWCRSCLICTKRRIGKAEVPPLTPIPVAGPFDRVGVDVIQFTKSHQGNRYAVVFVDYLTKWPEVFATPDQSALTIARLLVEHVISRHGVPRELLSDRGPAFLSKLLKEVCQLMGIKKTNTTAYHPQTDGLVERFNRTLIDMLAKTVEKSGRDWDTRLPFVLFAYRASPQESTQESPFFLMYGRDPQLPTEGIDPPAPQRREIDIDNYKSEVAQGMQEAWDLARENIRKSQKKQKRYYDRRAREPTFRIGEQVFLYVPSAKSGPAYKFALPYKGPYRVLKICDGVADVRQVDNPNADVLRVAISRLRHCPTEICSPNELNHENHEQSPGKESTPSEEPESVSKLSSQQSKQEHGKPLEKSKVISKNVWHGRLRSQKKAEDERDMMRTSSHKDREM